MENYIDVLLPLAGVVIAGVLFYGWKAIRLLVARSENTVDDAVVEAIASYAPELVVPALRAVVARTDTPYDNRLLEEVLGEVIKRDMVSTDTTTNN